MTSKYLDLLLNEEYINELAFKVGLCKRIRKIKPLELIKMLVFSQSNIAKDNLLNISLNLYEASNIDISLEALNKRFNSRLVEFLKLLLMKLLEVSTKPERIEKNIKERFNRILLTDSTVSQIHKSHSNNYPGGRNKEGTHAAVKINFIKDLKNENIIDIDLSSGTKNDFLFLSNLKKLITPKDLIINDLGYYSLDFFKYVSKKKGYFVSKLKLNSTKAIFIENPEPRYFKKGSIKPSSRYLQVDLEKACLGLKAEENKEISNVYIGTARKKLKCRLIITKLKKEHEGTRLKTITKKLKDPRVCLKKEKKEIAKYGFMITNLPKEEFSCDMIYPIYSLRWQIELDFKNWKSILEIDESGRKIKKERLECHFYGKLLNILVNNEISKNLKTKFRNETVKIFSEKKVFHRISYYLKEFYRYGYSLKNILLKLENSLVRDCFKSRKSAIILSDDILKMIC